jgi:very-short-patch-repair endonuclease
MNDLHKHFMAKLLRKNFTDTERLLWKYLRTKQMEGCKFRRQEPIGSYIVDFVCHEKRMIIEVDGGQHSADRERDDERDKWLEGQGYKVLRFWNNEVLTNIKGVLEVGLFESPSLNPSPQERGSKGGTCHQGRGKLRICLQYLKWIFLQENLKSHTQNEPKAY